MAFCSTIRGPTAGEACLPRTPGQPLGKPWPSPTKRQGHIGDFAGQPPFWGRLTPDLKGTEQLRRGHEFQIDPVQRVLGQVATGKRAGTANNPVITIIVRLREVV